MEMVVCPLDIHACFLFPVGTAPGTAVSNPASGTAVSNPASGTAADISAPGTASVVVVVVIALGASFPLVTPYCLSLFRSACLETTISSSSTAAPSHPPPLCRPLFGVFLSLSSPAPSSPFSLLLVAAVAAAVPGDGEEEEEEEEAASMVVVVGFSLGFFLGLYL